MKNAPTVTLAERANIEHRKAQDKAREAIMHAREAVPMRRVTDWTIRLLLVLCGAAIGGLLVGALFVVALRALL